MRAYLKINRPINMSMFWKFSSGAGKMGERGGHLPPASCPHDSVGGDKTNFALIENIILTLTMSKRNQEVRNKVCCFQKTHDLFYVSKNLEIFPTMRHLTRTMQTKETICQSWMTLLPTHMGHMLPYGSEI